MSSALYHRLIFSSLALQYKFDSLVKSLVGTDNIGLKSELRLGFYIMIAYSVFGCLLHYFFNSAVSEFYKIDPYHKIDYGWTKVVGCFLHDDEEAAKGSNVVQFDEAAKVANVKQYNNAAQGANVKQSA